MNELFWIISLALVFVVAVWQFEIDFKKNVEGITYNKIIGIVFSVIAIVSGYCFDCLLNIYWYLNPNPYLFK